ncbi:MAG: M48 family metallopeptidase [Paracoccus sp. (in: a-proteobacteria)]|nr:M48 family metallopeptidase [Paracoccus sp. (in: a-proteobacteria)]
MLKFLPLILILAYTVVLYFWSSFRLRQELRRNSTPLTDVRMRPVLDRLAGAMGVAAIPAHVYEIEPVNGLAAPDGRVFLTRGFLRKLDAGEVNEAELASVIAHELGHVALGHSRRRTVDFFGQNAIRVLGRFLPGIGPWLAGIVASLMAAALSRKDEFEADAFASALMVKAGFGTAPQIALFEKLGRLSGGGGATGLAWLRSHPCTDERIAAIRRNVARWSQS